MSLPRYLPPFAITLTSTCVGVPMIRPLLPVTSLRAPLALACALPRRLRARFGAELFVEESEYALVFVGPTVGAVEGVIFDGVGRYLPVLFAEFDEAFGEADGVLEVDVRVNHAVADEQRALQALGEVYGRAEAVCLRVVLRLVEYVRGVGMIVVRPVGDGTERRARREDVGRGEHRHQGYEAAVRAAVDTDAVRVNSVLVDEVADGIHVVVQILAAHVSINPRAPVAAIARASTVVDAQDR